MSSKLYVGNLKYEVTEEDLERLFKDYGEITSVKVIRDKFTGRSKGFAFVEMANDEAAKNAINSLDGNDFEGRNIKINIARERTERPGGGGGGGFSRRERY